jgi:Cu+-exporting ATPase
VKDIIEMKVDGMTCNNCAASLNKYLERKGLEDVYVNFQTKEVRYNNSKAAITTDEVKKGIHKLGFVVLEAEQNNKLFWTLERKLLISAIFTLPLLLAHLLMMIGVSLSFMDNYWLQMLICLPVYVIGFLHFGRSALSSLKGGVPNMDVLIFIGSTAAFIYSFVGTLLWEASYIFYETSATIITLVLLGNWLEKRAVEQTTTAIGELTALQVEKANLVTPDGQIVSVERKDIRVGNHLRVNEGDKIPMDGKVMSGQASVDESMLTGESDAIDKMEGDQVIGGSIVVAGQLLMEVESVGKNTVLGQMIELVKTAQQDKPDIQRLADRISAIFVPVVLGIALLTLLIGHFGFGLSFQQALMNSIAVLVISCPCAMGLATPTAVMVGVGRLARNGILVKGGQTVETLAQVQQIVFDKTGTLTDGQLKVEQINYASDDSQEYIHALIYEMEKYSSHPIAQTMRDYLEDKKRARIVLEDIEELKGWGMKARSETGEFLALGSYRMLPDHIPSDGAQLFLVKGDVLLASIHLSDAVKSDAAEVIQYFQKQSVNPIILSGDSNTKAQLVANQLGIQEYYAEQLPKQKLDKIAALSEESITAMVGDGINDAPALAKADLGISLSNASQVAIQSAQIVLLNGRLSRLATAFNISKATVLTIKQNLFWAFAYNVVAIPIAAMGFLNPMWGALFMAFSDIVVIGNSIRLKYKRLD